MLLLLALLACVEEEKDPAARVGEAWAACTLDDVSVPLTYTPTAASTTHLDSQGVAHIYAQNDADLFYAAGYEQGRQRLYQIDRARHATRGTLSEMDGESAFETDLIARTFNLTDLGCRTLKFQAQQRPDDFGLGVAFTAGLNRYISDLGAGVADPPTDFGQDELSYIPEPITVLDVVSMGKRINLGYSSQLDYDLLVSISDELVSDFDDVPVWEPGRARFIVDGEGTGQRARRRGNSQLRGVDTSAFPPDLGERLKRLATAQGVGRASNNWVFSGEHTDNGKPIMGNDPHSALENPSRVITWHLNSADAGGTFDAAGFSFPGVPGLHMGHNRHINWNATTNFADAMDLFDVIVDADGNGNIGGALVPTFAREETIRVLQADGSLLDTVVTVRGIHGHGIFLPNELLPIDKMVFAEGEVMVAWAGFDTNTQELFEFIDMDRASNLDEAYAAVGYEAVGQQNWVMASADGIRYRAHGNIPVRSGDPRRIQDASDPAVLWTGEYLDDSLFPSLDGTQDFIASANNAPFDHVEDNDPTNDAFYYGSYFDPGYRADRIQTMATALVARGNIGMDDMVVMQRDVVSGLAEDLVPLLVDVGARIDSDESLAAYRDRPELIAAIASLESWDRSMDQDSAPAAIFHTWQALLGRRTLAGDMSVLFDAVAEATPVTVAKLNALAHVQELDALLDGKGSTDMLAALSDAIEWLEQERSVRGVETLVWGDIHTARFAGTWQEDIDLPFSGDESTVNVADCPAWGGGDLNSPCASKEGSIYRAIGRFGEDDVPELWFHTGMGGVGQPDDWANFEYRYLPFRTEEVLADSVASWTLEP